MEPILIAFRQCQSFWRKVLLLSLLTSFTINLSTTLLAQNLARRIKFERIGTEQGLSHGRLHDAILQDHQGFMWFGTTGGLNKYDGYSFTVYKSDPADPNSLSHGEIRSLYEDRAGVLWIGTTGGGLNGFDRETETFSRYQHDPNNPNSLSENFVRTIYEDHTGVLWIGTDGGLNKFDRKRETFTRYQHDPSNPNSLSDDVVYPIYEDRAGVLWIGTDSGGLNKFDRETETFTRYQHDPNNPNSLSPDRIWSICEDRAGVFWLGTDGGLYKFDREKETFTRYQHDPNNPNSLSANVVRGVFEDRAGVLWLGTSGGGLNQFDRERGIFIHYKHDPQNPNSMSHNSVGLPYEDHAGILWIGSWGEGLNKFDRAKEQFSQYKNEPSNPNSLSYNFVSALLEDHTGVLWIGNAWGRRLNRLNKFDRETRTFTHYQHDLDNANWIWSLYEDRSGALWIGDENDGLYKLDRKTETFIRYQLDPDNANKLNYNRITALYEDSGESGVFWIGTQAGGLYKFDRKTETLIRYLHDPNNPYSLSNNSVSSLYEDRTGVFWIGTNGGGLNRFDRAKERFTHYKNDPDNPRSLSHNWVLSLHEDAASRDILWIGTNGGGLNKFDREKGVFTRYRQSDGLPDDVICGILQDDHGLLWLSTQNGMCRFDPLTAESRSYDVSDGLQGKEFNPGASHKSRRTGEMFFGGLNGFNIFHPDSVRDNPYIPPVVITAFKRYNLDKPDGEPIIEKGISAKKGITLSYKDNILAFEFAALSYRNTHKNQYAYKLEGFNNTWIHLGTKRDITFTGLDPGEYTLRVKGSNNDGVWNEEGASLKIAITPPWWRTRWAYAFYALLFMALLYGWRRFELNRVKLRNELKMKNFEAQKLQEMDQMKSRFFANISHEFRTPLTLILGPVEQMRANEFKGNWNDGFDMILRNGRRLLRLINQLLDLARLEAGRLSLQARPENIVSFLKGLVLSFASAAERKRIALSISATEKNLVVYFDRDKLEKIVSNLLSNALKFTLGSGKITVVVCRDKRRGERPFAPTTEYVEISVSDTGPGIPADQLDKIFDRFYQVDASHTREHEGTGIGLALTKELVELHHGEIFVQSEVGRGTTFVVRLPLGRTHLKPEEVASDQFAMASEKDAVFPSLQQSTTPSLQELASSDETIILVVEDNRDVRAYIRQYLEPAFKIVEAVDGIDGAQKALDIIPDLIISDVMMPKRDGNELCRILKTDERTSHVPIIMLTAKADRDSKVQGLETGADDYLIKPFDSKELLARVHNLIELRRQLRERFSREIVLKPQDIAITPVDEVFLNKVKAVVEKNLAEEDFEIELLAREVGMSRVHLHRKLKALTDQSASQFIRFLRLQRAVELLKKNAGTVAEIAYQVGFGSQAYFTKCFHEQFGCSPKEYVKNNP